MYQYSLVSTRSSRLRNGPPIWRGGMPVVVMGRLLINTVKVRSESICALTLIILYSRSAELRLDDAFPRRQVVLGLCFPAFVDSDTPFHVL